MDISEDALAKLIMDMAPNVRLAAKDYHTPLTELGIDSLDVATIFLAIQEKYSIKVPDAKIDELDTVVRIHAYLEKS